MKQRLLFALMLADEGISDVQNDMIAQCLQCVDFWNRARHPLGVGLEPDEIIHTASGKAVEVARYTCQVVIEQGSDVDDFGHFLADQS